MRSFQSNVFILNFPLHYKIHFSGPEWDSSDEEDDAPVVPKTQTKVKSTKPSKGKKTVKQIQETLAVIVIPTKELKMTNALSVPLQYQVEEGVDNPKMISIKCTDADGNENKEEVHFLETTKRTNSFGLYFEIFLL